MKKIKRVIIITLFSVLFVFSFVFAACSDPNEGEDTYVKGLDFILKSDNTYEVKATSPHITGELIIPSTCRKNNVTNNVTSIANKAFYTCSGLTSITIPNSVTSIGGDAFYNCRGLTSITVPGSVTSIGIAAFNGCSGLTSVTIENGVTSIGGLMFNECSALKSIEIPASVTSIGAGAFQYCTSLETVIYKGTSAQWVAVEKGASPFPSTVSIVCAGN